MFCVYHSIVMHLTAPKWGFYKKTKQNIFFQKASSTDSGVSEASAIDSFQSHSKPIETQHERKQFGSL